MTPEEIAKAVMSKWYAGPTLAKHVGLVAPAIAAALRERDAAWAKATVEAGRCSQNTRCSAVRMDWQACDRCAPLRALLEEAGK